MICVVKNANTRCAVFGVGESSEAMEAARERIISVEISRPLVGTAVFVDFRYIESGCCS